MSVKTICFLGNLVIKPFIKKYSEEYLRKSTPNKILVIKSGAIGDVLMTTPFLRALRKRFPTAEIDYLTSKESAEVLEGNKNISQVIAAESSDFHSLNLFKKNKLLKIIRRSQYDFCFILDKSQLANLFILFTGIPVRIGFDRFGEGFANNVNVKYGELKYEINYYLELSYLTGAKEDKNKNLELNLTIEDKKFAEEIFKKNKIKNAICIAPGGGKNPGVGIDSTRIWPEKDFIELINMLKNSKVILIGGEKDKELCDRISKSITSELRKKVLNLAGQTSLKESAAVMQKCSCVITNDAGPMHIASAVNKKVISIFGPTHPLRKAPLHKESKWIWKDEDKYDSRGDVYSTKYAEGKKFMEDVTPEVVFDTIREVLKK